MESPEEESAIACPMVWHAAVEDKQLLLSLPLTPFTYRVVLDRAVGTVANSITATAEQINPSLDYSVPRLERLRAGMAWCEAVRIGACTLALGGQEEEVVAPGEGHPAQGSEAAPHSTAFSPVGS